MPWAVRHRYWVELGTMAEVFQPEDTRLQVSRNFINLAAAYRLPLFINTKGNLLTNDDSYRRLVFEYPAPLIVSMSLIGHDDALVGQYVRGAPPPSALFKLIGELRHHGIPTVVYLAPWLKEVSDVDYPGFVQAMIEAGAIGVHLRTLYVAGKLESQARWRHYVEKHRDDMKRKGRVWEWKSSVMRDAYLRIQAEADRLDPRFQVVGVKEHWYDLNPHHGKLCFDPLPQRYRDGIMDFTAIPILRLVREREDEPQLLRWADLGYQRGLIAVPDTVNMNEGGSAYLYVGRCCTTHFYRDYTLDGFDWVKAALWSGYFPHEPGGWIGSVKRHYPVTDGPAWAKDEDSNFVYAYIPPDLTADYVVEGAPTCGDAGCRGSTRTVPLERLRGVHVPKRVGGTSDKWLSMPDKAYDFIR